MSAVEEPADLTPLQRKYLCNLHQFCRRPPTLAFLYAKTFPSYFLLFAFIGLLCYGVVEYGMVEGAYVLGGMLIGVVVRDLGTFRRAIALWPATSAVVDREKLAMLTEQHLNEPEHW